MFQIPEGAELLRDVTIDSQLRDTPAHHLVTWEPKGQPRCDTGQWKVGYAFFPAGASEPLFWGEDFGCAPSDAIDSDACLAGIVFFLTLKPGDTDSDFFADYTPEQMAWCESYACETLSLIGCEPSDSDDYREVDGTYLYCGEPAFRDAE